MKHISILVPEGDISLSNLEATHKMFNMANGTLQKIGKKSMFEIHLIGINEGTRSSNGIFGVIPDTTIAEVHKTDLIIIPAIHGDYNEIISANSAFVPWIRDQYKKGAEIASLCIGAFLLASTGLLNGRNCTTHWLAADEFRKLFPQVNLLDDRIITDEMACTPVEGPILPLTLTSILWKNLREGRWRYFLPKFSRSTSTVTVSRPLSFLRDKNPTRTRRSLKPKSTWKKILEKKSV